MIVIFPVVVRDHAGSAVQPHRGCRQSGLLGARQHVPQWMDGDLAR